MFLVRRVRQGRIRHAMLGGAGARTLHGHAKRIQTDVSRRLLPRPRRRPRRPRPRRFDHATVLLLRPQSFAGRLGATQDRRGRHAHVGETLQDVLGRIGEGRQRPRQTDQRHQTGADLILQTRHVVVGNETLTAPTAVVISPPHPHFPMHGQHAPLPVRVELRGIVAVPAGHAAPYVPLFSGRPPRLAGPRWLTPAPRRGTRSRWLRTPALREHRRPVRPSVERLLRPWAQLVHERLDARWTRPHGRVGMGRTHGETPGVR